MEPHQYRPTAREELAVQIIYLLRLKEREEGLLGKSDEEMVNEILAPYIVERQEQSTIKAKYDKCKYDLRVLEVENAKLKAEIEQFKSHTNERCLELFVKGLCKIIQQQLEEADQLQKLNDDLRQLTAQKLEFDENLKDRKYELPLIEQKLAKDIQVKIKGLEENRAILKEECVRLEDEYNCTMMVLYQLFGPNVNITEVISSLPPEAGKEKVLKHLRLEGQDWFWGHIHRDEANALINSPRTKEGSFIIRRSESQPGKFVLHIKIKGKNRVFLIHKYGNGQYGFSEMGNMFASVTELVQFHQKHSLQEITAEEDLTLQCPVPKPKLLSPMALLRDKINDLEKQVTVSELANEMKSKKGEYINLDMPFAEAIILPNPLPPLGVELIMDFIAKMSPKWETIGCALWMAEKVAQLRHTERSVESKLLELLQDWSQKLDASWEKLLEATYQAGLQVVACKINRKLKDVVTLFPAVM